jgi:hypothetical protein
VPRLRARARFSLIPAQASGRATSPSCLHLVIRFLNLKFQRFHARNIYIVVGL